MKRNRIVMLAVLMFASAWVLHVLWAGAAIADIGAVAVRVLGNAGRFTGKRFDLASDKPTGNDALAIFSRATGPPL